MHRSRLGALVIDCRTQDLDAAAGFWAAALGLEAEHGRDPVNARYRRLAGDDDQPKVLVQQVGHESRVHLDIEADDVEAEVARLERLGARRVEKLRDWWVLESPTGHRFCVVPAARPDFRDRARVWDEG